MIKTLFQSNGLDPELGPHCLQRLSAVTKVAASNKRVT